VGRHGRESHALVQGVALMFPLVLAAQLTPLSFPYQDLMSEIASKIVAAVAPLKSVHLEWADADRADEGWLPQLQSQLAQTLTARGLRVLDSADGAALVTIGCSQNLRERVCSARVRKGGASSIVMVTRPLDARVAAGAEPSLTIEMHPLFGGRTPILDVALADDRLLVLDPAAVTLFRRSGSGWQSERSQPISSSRIRPRDIRGHLRVDATTIEVFLPGTTCRSALSLFNLTCADEQQAWPLGIENAGLMASRNYFTTPEGTAFYGSATLGSDADARWLLAAQDGRLVFLDSERHPLDSGAGHADDIVGIITSCAAGTYVLLPSRTSDSKAAEALSLFRVVARRLIPAASPALLPGPLTALWDTQDGRSVIAVSHSLNTGRYEAFQIDVSCGR